MSIQADASNQTGGSRITLEVDGTEHMRVTAAGLVGIGTSVPSYNLQTDVLNGNSNFIGIRQADQIMWSIGQKASDTNMSIPFST